MLYLCFADDEILQDADEDGNHKHILSDRVLRLFIYQKLYSRFTDLMTHAFFVFSLTSTGYSRSFDRSFYISSYVTSLQFMP